MKQSPRKNKSIRAEKVQVVGHKMEQFGILPISEALALANRLGLDLVEIAPACNPPLCRLTPKRPPASHKDEIGLAE
jgi:translation initiation factor IF-3